MPGDRRFQPPKEVEMRFAHLKRILGLGELRLRGPSVKADTTMTSRFFHSLGVIRRGVDRRSAYEAIISPEPKRSKLGADLY
jgi:hypothetical protein